MRSFASSVASNLVANLLIIAAVAVYGVFWYRLRDEADNTLELRVWMVLLAVGILLVLVGWLMWLTLRLTRTPDEALAPAGAQPVAPPGHPYAQLLEQLT